ncbi:hypothetical protein ACYULU_10960 [Breznakiellaceae bacterium SP9]
MGHSWLPEKREDVLRMTEIWLNVLDTAKAAECSSCHAQPEASAPAA